jgi:tRNA(fMet)-specific endonuclease VapC
MNLYLLDTDIVSFVLGDHPLTVERLRANQNNAVVSIVTVHESFNGWVTRINSAKTIEEVIILYARLARLLALFKKIRVLDFDESAASQLRLLLQNNAKLNKNKLEKDMRIAAIALANNAIVVTRNQKDFAQVPGLNIVDWTKSGPESQEVR